VEAAATERPEAGTESYRPQITLNEFCKQNQLLNSDTLSDGPADPANRAVACYSAFPTKRVG